MRFHHEGTKNAKRQCGEIFHRLHRFAQMNFIDISFLVRSDNFLVVFVAPASMPGLCFLRETSIPNFARMEAGATTDFQSVSVQPNSNRVQSHVRLPWRCGISCTDFQSVSVQRERPERSSGPRQIATGCRFVRRRLGWGVEREGFGRDFSVGRGPGIP